MGLTSTFSIALRGLQISQAALEVVSHNIANVNTDGYSRQRINLETALPWMSRIGPLGSGVDAANVSRMHDDYLTASLIDKNSTLSKYEAEKVGADSLESIFNESQGNGINKALSDFWNAWQEVADNPEATPQRADLLEKADTLAKHIQLARQDMDALRTDLNQRVEQGIGQVNTLVTEIAAINSKIVAQEASKLQNANDLRDKRDQYIKDLAALVDIDYFEDPATGAVSVVTKKGTPLVSDYESWPLKAKRDENGDIAIMWERGNGGEVDITANVQSGTLGGLVELRDVIMKDFYTQFEAYTEGLIKEVNRQHSQGVGLTKYKDLTSTSDLSDYAGVQVNFPGDDNDIKLTSMSKFAPTDKIGIKFVKAAATGTAIAVNTVFDPTTSTYNITVTLPVNTNGNVTATAKDVVKAINDTRSTTIGDPAPYPPTIGPPYQAGDLIRADLANLQKGLGTVDALNDPLDPAGTGLDFIRLNHDLANVLPFGQDITYGYQNARLQTKLPGDNNDLLFQAIATGDPGTNISLQYVDPGAANQSLTITVDPVTQAIRVSLATDSGGNITTTAEDIADAINSDPTAKNLVTVDRAAGESGSGRVSAMDKTYLSRAGSFDLVVYDAQGRPTINKITVTPTDTRDDILNQIGSTFGTGVIGLSAEIVEDTGKHYIRIKADNGYSFAFGNDNTGALMALGLNTFFSGDGDLNVAVNDTVMNDPSLIASGQVDSHGMTTRGDNTNVLALANIKDKQFSFLDQSSTISEAYNTLLANVGATTNSITRNHDFNQSLVDQIMSQRDMISAVNLDDEMADMMKFQYMYQAAAKVISTTDDMLQTLLSVK